MFIESLTQKVASHQEMSTNEESNILLSKAVEIFLLELSLRLSLQVEGTAQTELNTQMLRGIFEEVDVFDFLNFICPEEQEGENS